MPLDREPVEGHEPNAEAPAAGSTQLFGLYLAYPLGVDLRTEGLGRHLGEWLRAASRRGDCRFVIACPSWTRTQLFNLLDSYAVPRHSFEFVTPRDAPSVLLLANLLSRRASRTVRRPARARRPKKPRRRTWRAGWEAASRILAAAIFRPRGLLSLVALVAIAIPLAPLVAVAVAVRLGLRKVSPLVRPLGRRVRQGVQWWRGQVARLAGSRKLHAAEMAAVDRLVAARTDVAAWMTPAPFWPDFNRIPRPRLTCVPDVVLHEFPVSFAERGGAGMFARYTAIKKTIAESDHFVTYSEHVKQGTLVERHDVEPHRITVIRHGVNRLDALVTVRGFPDDREASETACRQWLAAALHKAVGSTTAAALGAGRFRFFFYASQFRPNKNLPTLLRAYRHLRQEHGLGHKLILTGHPAESPDVREFIESHSLQHDVLCLHGLTARELAACYRLAELAVNPSLSEGGCPFTFGEAMSVETPVLMARIPVTEEVIRDKRVCDAMLFDPYDWQELADRMVWALSHRQELYALQKPAYDEFIARTWDDVVSEYVELLSSLARRSRTAPAQSGPREDAQAPRNRNPWRTDAA